MRFDTVGWFASKAALNKSSVIVKGGSVHNLRKQAASVKAFHNINRIGNEYSLPLHSKIKRSSRHVFNIPSLLSGNRNRRRRHNYNLHVNNFIHARADNIGANRPGKRKLAACAVCSKPKLKLPSCQSTARWRPCRPRRSWRKLQRLLVFDTRNVCFLPGLTAWCFLNISGAPPKSGKSLMSQTSSQLGVCVCAFVIFQRYRVSEIAILSTSFKFFVIGG